MDCGLPSGSFGHWRQALEEGEKLRADCGLPSGSSRHRRGRPRRWHWL